MLVKRSCLLLKGLEITTSRIKGEIIQIGNSNIINFDLPLLQEDIVKGEERSIEIKISHNNNYRKHLQSQGQELDYLDFIDTILLYEHPDSGGEFIKYISADLILERTISQMWNCEIEGKIDSLLTFEVLYIGEAVRSKIWLRVVNHEKIQQILSQESPKNLGVSIAHEIQILFFKLESTSDIRIINEMSREQGLDYLLRKDQTTDEVLYFDVEKAFIKALKPKYNVQLYQNYPESKNGMMDEKYNHILYRIEFPYTLRTESNSFNANQTEVLAHLSPKILGDAYKNYNLSLLDLKDIALHLDKYYNLLADIGWNVQTSVLIPIDYHHELGQERTDIERLLDIIATSSELVSCQEDNPRMWESYERQFEIDGSRVEMINLINDYRTRILNLEPIK